MSLYYTARTEVVNSDKIMQEGLLEIKSFMEKEALRMHEVIFTKSCDTIEEWLFERIDNVMRSSFDYVTNYLLGVTTSYVPEERKKEIDEYLTGIGYTANSFRKMLFEENREEILKAFQGDSIYLTLVEAFDRHSFSGYRKEHLKTAYPQTLILKGFAKYMMIQKDFKEYLSEEIDDNICKARDELMLLYGKIDEARSIISSLVEE